MERLGEISSPGGKLHSGRHEHQVKKLPPEYEGFLLINGLQLSEPDTRAMLNFTRGDIRPPAIKEWLRKNETKLSASDVGSDRKRTNQTMALDYPEDDENLSEDDLTKEIQIMEAHLTSLRGDDGTEDDDILEEEEEAAELLATMIKQKKTFKQSMREKKERELSRGYGMPPRPRPGGPGQRDPGLFRPGHYKVSVEELKRKTKRNHCGVVGHWKRECPQLSKGKTDPGPRPREAHALETMTPTDEAIFIGSLELDSEREVFEPSQLNEQLTVARSSESPEAYKDGHPAPQCQRPFCDDVYDLFVFETLLSHKLVDMPINDHTCATVDTGCQRLAIGSHTLQQFARHLPGQLVVTLHPETNRFRSVHQISTTTKVATVPSSLQPCSRRNLVGRPPF